MNTQAHRMHALNALIKNLEADACEPCNYEEVVTFVIKSYKDAYKDDIAYISQTVIDALIND